MRFWYGKYILQYIIHCHRFDYSIGPATDWKTLKVGTQASRFCEFQNFLGSMPSKSQEHLPLWCSKRDVYIKSWNQHCCKCKLLFWCLLKVVKGLTTQNTGKSTHHRLITARQPGGGGRIFRYGPILAYCSTTTI